MVHLSVPNKNFNTLTKKIKNTFTAREVGDSCNNLVLRSLRPVSLGEIPEARIRKLRAYSQAVMAPMLKHVEEELLRPEEVVMILATAALFVQLRYVLRSDKVPMGISARDLYEGPEAVVLPAEYFATADPVSDPGGAKDEVLPRVGKTRKRR